ncbi:MAG: outer membrane protein assembly factor BamD [Bacteroidota bacterium]
MRIIKSILLISSLVMIFGCSEYQKLLKSSDFELKYTKAVEYYQNEDYFRALSLFEELLTMYKGTTKAEEIYYFYSYCHYNQGDHILAGYHFANFSKTYPNSKHKEECMYMSAYCLFLNSPEPSLDQSYTYKAIDELQLFINRFPKSERVAQCNDLIGNLRTKLEIKSFNNAKLYFDIRDYKAAIVSLKNSLKEFPDTRFREESLFLILRSSYILAENSIEKKKLDRYQQTLTEYYALIDEYPQSSYLKRAEDIYDSSQKIIEKLKTN